MQNLIESSNLTDDAIHRIHDTWRCNEDIIRICDLSSKTPYLGAMLGQTSAYIDHFKVFQTKDRQAFIFDDPYIPSNHIHTKYENEMIYDGFRILHLPQHMSRYVVGKCQPRLIAPPKSKANLPLIAYKLALGKFRGNTMASHEFRDTPYPIDDEVEAAFQQAIIDPNYGSNLYTQLRRIANNDEL